jgi:3-methylfumaryl-CoA hydratase
MAETISPLPVERLCATLNLPQQLSTSDDLPPGWQWLYFLEASPTNQLSHGGHTELGDFMPPVPFPRRMWAGGTFQYVQPISIGQTIERTSTVSNITLKQGRTGPLIFVPVQHTFTGPKGLALVEEQTIVYRPAPKNTEPSTPAPYKAPHIPHWSQPIRPTAVLLFRYSALTFNGHRIHYDNEYCLQEGYPGLLVHGALTITLLLELLRQHLPQACIEGVNYRAISPLYSPHIFTIHGHQHRNTVTLWTLGPDGQLAMQADVTLGPTNNS